VGWGAGGAPAESFGINNGTDVEDGFLKLYITGDYANLEFIKQDSIFARGAKEVPQRNHSAEFWGAIRIPFVLERKRTEGEQENKDNLMAR
jgi:hypothetical protein